VCYQRATCPGFAFEDGIQLVLTRLLTEKSTFFDRLTAVSLLPNFVLI
jgi:hypothetical protein